jgi:hypothetical protein
MRCSSRCLLLVASLLLSVSSNAAAQEWGRGFFEKMSGPRFKVSHQGFPIACLWRSETPTEINYRVSPFWKTFKDMEAWDIDSKAGTLVNEESRRLVCLDFEYNLSENTNANDLGVGLIHFREFNGNFGFPLEKWHNKLEAIEPGLGLGLSRFDNVEATWRFTVTPYFIVKPLKFGFRDKVDAPNKRWDWRSVIEVSVALVVFTNKVSDGDLGIRTIGAPISLNEPFNDRARWRFLYSIDAGELLGFR